MSVALSAVWFCRQNFNRSIFPAITKSWPDAGSMLVHHMLLLFQRLTIYNTGIIIFILVVGDTWNNTIAHIWLLIALRMWRNDNKSQCLIQYFFVEGELLHACNEHNCGEYMASMIVCRVRRVWRVWSMESRSMVSLLETQNQALVHHQYDYTDSNNTVLQYYILRN